MNGVLNNVKVGDKLFVKSQWNKRIETVEKVTKLHVVTRNVKYRKDGTSVDRDVWNCLTARPATDEDIENIRKEVARQKMLSECRGINFDNLTDSQLEAILKIANKEEEV